MNGAIAKALLSAALLFGFAGGAAAEKLDEVKARGKLLVGNSDTSPPFSSRENGKVVGYDIDLAAQVAKRLGVGMEFVSVINSERIPALQQDRIDLAASGMTRADNRRHLIGFSLAYLVSPHTVIIRKDSGIKTVKQMAQKKLALVKGASVDAELKAAVPTMEIEHFDTYALCFDALRERKVAGFLADEVLLDRRRFAVCRARVDAVATRARRASNRVAARRRRGGAVGRSPSARLTSSTRAKRCAGSGSRQRRITRSQAKSRSGRCARTQGASRASGPALASDGRCPVSRW